jgi:hypothetical protein
MLQFSLLLSRACACSGELSAVFCYRESMGLAAVINWHFYLMQQLWQQMLKQNLLWAITCFIVVINMSVCATNVLSFMEIVGNLKRTKRTGWVRSGIELPESVADHSYRMAMLSNMIMDPNIDKFKLLKSELFCCTCKHICKFKFLYLLQCVWFTTWLSRLLEILLHIAMCLMMIR